MEKERKEFIEVKLNFVQLDSKVSLLTDSMMTEGTYDDFNGTENWWEQW